MNLVFFCGTNFVQISIPHIQYVVLMFYQIYLGYLRRLAVLCTDKLFDTIDLFRNFDVCFVVHHSDQLVCSIQFDSMPMPVFSSLVSLVVVLIRMYYLQLAEGIDEVMADAHHAHILRWKTKRNLNQSYFLIRSKIHFFYPKQNSGRSVCVILVAVCIMSYVCQCSNAYRLNHCAGLYSVT